ncbi:MAG: NAD(P)/FAD-dependent oxidoreductase [Chloroflexota bacterium]|nr:NAD(P)/FAD-dependent oxidoreductase [Chloroflexota bacterium]
MDDKYKSADRELLPMDYDIIIVGAGPSGLSTALHLAQLAPELAERTLVVERESHPRSKLCAGGITPGGAAWLNRLGLDLSSVPFVDVCEAHFQFEGRGFVVRREPFVFHIVRRDEFDAWLANAARERGLALQEETLVRRVRCFEDGDDNGVEVETNQGTYRARVVVGADGATSVVRRAVVRGHAPQVSRLLEILVPVAPLSPCLDAEGTGDNERAIIDFSWIADGVQGYVWDFPTQVQKQPMHTWGIFDSRIHPKLAPVSLKVVWQKELARRGVALDGQELKGHPLRWFRPHGVFSAPRVLLVGDAAGVDPLLGEGISFALGYGEVAARQLQDAFAQDDFSFKEYRRRVLIHRTGRFLRRRYVVAWVIYGIRNRWLLRFLSWNLGPFMGWLAERFWVDWGE